MGKPSFEINPVSFEVVVQLYIYLFGGLKESLGKRNLYLKRVGNLSSVLLDPVSRSIVALYVSLEYLTLRFPRIEEAIVCEFDVERVNQGV